MFKTRFSRYEKLIAYLQKHWMCPQWRFLWLKAGRHHIGHACLETSNVAETFFRTFKVDVLKGKQPSDIYDFFKMLYGVPDEEASQTMSYLHTMYI